MKKLFCGIIADPVSNFNPKVETTSFIALELQSRGHKVGFIQLSDLFLENGEAKAKLHFYKIEKNEGSFSYQSINEKIIFLKDLDVLFLRKDPPVDLLFLTHLTLLEKLEEKYSLDCGSVEKKILFFNSPGSVKKYFEKIYPFSFPGFSPPTLISSSSKLIDGFIVKNKKVVLKPLNLLGGVGIVTTSAKDPNKKSLIEILTRSEQDYIVCQKFIPEVKKGDKRILILGGKVLGAFLRVATHGDFRSNLHVGGSLKKTFLTQQEKRIADVVGKDAVKKGFYFVGLDMIGGYVTEINVTSPMGLNEVNQTENSHSEKAVISWIEKKMRVSKPHST